MTVPTIEKANGHPPRLLPTQPIPATEPPPDPVDDTSPKTTANPGRRDMLRVLAGLAFTAGSVVAGIGFAGSYSALRALAARNGFGVFSYVFPVGIDAGIVALQAIDLYLVARRAPMAALRWLALLLTGATIWFNAAAAGSGEITRHPLTAAMHAAMPVLYIAVTHAARHWIGRRAQILAGAVDLGAPTLRQWLYAPFRTFKLNRRMRLVLIPFEELLRQDHELTVYAQQLADRYGADWKKSKEGPKPTAAELLPFRVADRGIGVAKALGIPAVEQIKKIQREAEEAVQRSQADIQRVDADLQLRTAELQAEEKRVRAEGNLDLARRRAQREIEIDLQCGEADLQRQLAERQAALQLLQDESEARRLQLADDTERRRFEASVQREKDQFTWDMQRLDLQAQADAEGDRVARESADRKKALADQARESEEALRLAKARAKAEEEAALRKAAEDHLATVEAHRLATESSNQAAQNELAQAAATAATARETASTAEAEAATQAALTRTLLDGSLAGLTQQDWQTLRVMAAISAAGGDAEKVKGEWIAAELGVSTGTASARKAAAVDHLTNPARTPLTELLEPFRRALGDRTTVYGA
ncbi:DUF2637 domain-containing protein [Kitasatospora sp. NPDC048296]|uniref:DUF2637 domain-containing protein n=1 Tax=Kitasatospora sp. NPDC048296 TaxID=3364048 RepID=UPI00371B6FCC